MPVDDKTAKNFQTLEARTPNFYIQPKAHEEDNSGSQSLVP